MTKDLIGQQLGSYRLVSLLGSGGFAKVYLGQHVRLSSKQAAIKVLHAHLTNEQIQEFEQEADTIVKLKHPHIVHVEDFNVCDDTPFLVMDYCPNGTLRQLHPKGKCVPLPTVVSYVQQVADALQYAHDHKLIHRDVKPANMLISQQNAILLSDFGIAATAHSTHSMRIQNFAGTAPYMAPEQIKLHPRRESDQYALAVVTYEWLTGELPFLGTPEEIAIKHLAVEPPCLCQKLPDLSANVEKAVFKALAKNPKERFASVQDFATALEQASQTKPPIAMPPQQNTAPSRSTLASSSRISTPPMVPVQTSIEMDTPVAQPLAPAIATMAEQLHTQAIPHTSTSRSPIPKQPPALSSVPRHKANFTTQNVLSTQKIPRGSLKQSAKIVFLLTAMLVIMLSSGIYLLARTGNIHSTQTSRTVNTTPNAAATEKTKATAQANTILTDSLNQNNHDWIVGTYNNHTFGFEDGAYHIANNSPDHPAIALLPDEDMPEPFTYTLTMSEVKGDDATTSPTKLNLFGLVFRYNQKDQTYQAFYCFEVKPTNNNADYQFNKYDSTQSSPWTQIWHQPLGSEYHLGYGAANNNTVKIVANGSNFTFLVNGKQVGTASDNALQHGQIGMLVNQQGAEFAFSNLMLTHS